jgi:hypothetical protein
MIMRTNFKYYVNGQAPTADVPVYGLYSPISDCFYFVYHDYRVLQESRVLLSSKFDLHIVRLDTAENWAANLVDNECCENWTWANKEDLSWGKENYPDPMMKFTDFHALHHAQQLVPSTHVTQEIEKYAQWIMLCVHYYISLTKLVRNRTYEFDQRLKDLIPHGDSLSYDTNQKYILDHQIRSLLYNGVDINLVDQAIIKLLPESQYINA